MSDEIQPNQLRRLLREQLDNKEYWQDSEMRQFRVKFWEPMDVDLNLVANEIDSNKDIFEGLSDFFKNILNF